MKTIHYLILTTVLLNATRIGLAQDPNEAAVEEMVKDNTDFAFDLYAQLKEKEGNLFFSPYSISAAMAMTYAGARGETAEQMIYVLHFSGHPQEFHPRFGHIIDQLNQQGQKGDYQLSIANALWGQKDYQFLDSFTDLNNTYYHAGLENVDFVSETEKTRQQINQWVEDKTNDKIEDLIPQGALNALTRLVLTNAIYFKGDWASQFDKAGTKIENFYISADKTVETPLMHQKEEFNYGQTETLQMLELPYKGDDLSMLILLPKGRDKAGNILPSNPSSIEVVRGRSRETLRPQVGSLNIAEFENQLTGENLAKWQKHMHKKEVLVYLPKFKMSSQFSLSGTLAKMGMPDAFGENADFSGMDGTRNLFISAVLHKAFVEVNEEGTEAAAATGVMMSLSAAIGEPPVFRADHPFVFLIRDNNTGSILFVGRVVDPTKESK